MHETTVARPARVREQLHRVLPARLDGLAPLTRDGQGEGVEALLERA